MATIKKQQHTYIQAICSSSIVLQSWFPASCFPSSAFLKICIHFCPMSDFMYGFVCTTCVQCSQRPVKGIGLRTALRMLHPNSGPMGKRHVISTAEPSFKMNALSLTPFANSDSSWTSWRIVSFSSPLFVCLVGFFTTLIWNMFAFFFSLPLF